MRAAMMHDFSKPQPHVASREEIAKKRKLPVYMLIIVGVFLIALLVYMVADHSANPTAQVMISNLQSVLLNA
jgi:flagellar biosynthesis/type III secretory pathway M-ring protein FliF/YscJ